jgi:hypothetical protein
MANRSPDRIETIHRVLGALAQLAPLITALTGAAMAGHNLGWW